MNYRVVCYALTCQFVHLLLQKSTVPHTFPPPPLQNYIQRLNDQSGPSKKFPFCAFHCRVNVVTRCWHSECSHQPAARNRLRRLVVNLFSWREIDRWKIALSDFTLHSLQLFFHSSTPHHATRQTEALSISCRLGGWVGRLRLDGRGDGGRKTILHLSTLRENQSCHHKWEVWMNFISWFLSCSHRWLSDWPVPLIGLLRDP